MFDLKEFEKEYSYGDLSGLEYLEKTIINEMKDKNKNNKTMFFTKEDYLISLFYAVKELNYCNNIYETDYKQNAKDFKYRLYFDAKYLLFLELEKYLSLKVGAL